ncbi:MAG: diguanylate cyclase [Campylobacterales bacterium]|nr:diguanylate cyclase [Campylobacterales bacterium]
MDKVTILIVDDEPINLKLVAQSLKERYTIFVVRSGAEALELLQNHHIDLILLDINMPQMDGFEVAEKLKNSSRTAQIPVIFLTADNSQETIVQAFEVGAVDYIIKPFQPEELNVRVDNHVRTNQLQKALQKALKNNIHLLEIIDAYVSFIKVNPQGIIQEISDNFCKQLACEKESILGKNVNILKSGHTHHSLYQKLWETIQSGETFSYDIQDCSFAGGTNWYHVTISPDYNYKNELIGYIAFYENIDEKIRFKHDAQTDMLTGLMNRAKIDETLQIEIKRVQRFEYPLSLILVDIDHFKEVNDTYGHQTGDIILKEFAVLLTENIRETDSLGRWGGEEFLIICLDTNAKGAFTLAENLRKVVESATFSIIGSKTSSFGVCEYSYGECIEETFKHVDDALYQAKEQGRNKVILFEYPIDHNRSIP